VTYGLFFAIARKLQLLPSDSPLYSAKNIRLTVIAPKGRYACFGEKKQIRSLSKEFDSAFANLNSEFGISLSFSFMSIREIEAKTINDPLIIPFSGFDLEAFESSLTTDRQ